MEWVLRVLRVLFQGFISASLACAKNITVRVRTLQADLQKFFIVVCSGFTSLSTIFQSYYDGVWLRQGAQ